MLTYTLDTTADFEAVVIDLTRDQLDAVGWRWTFIGCLDAREVPLMHTSDDPDSRGLTLALDDLYARRGPLWPAAARPTAAVLRAVLAPEIDSPQCMACHDAGCTACVRPPLPTRTVHRSPADPVLALATGATAPVVPVSEPKPAEPAPAVTVPSPSTFARLLAKLKRGAR